ETCVDAWNTFNASCGSGPIAPCAPTRLAGSPVEEVDLSAAGIARWATSGAAVVTCAVLLGPAGAAAATDTTAPTVTALAASPTAVDTSTAPAVVTVTATLIDDSSGVPTFRSLVSLRSPSGKQTTAGTFVALGGNAFSASVKIAAHSETG